MKKGVGIILIVLSIFLGYLGITGLDESRQSLNIGDIKIAAEDESEKTTSFIYIGAAIVSLAGGVYLLSKK